jgi:ribosomal protein L37AE/L43A
MLCPFCEGNKVEKVGEIMRYCPECKRFFNKERLA